MRRLTFFAPTVQNQRRLLHDFYKLLAVSRNASAGEIESAFIRRITAEESITENKTAEEIEKINHQSALYIEAYQILSDQVQRKLYDQGELAQNSEPLTAQGSADKLVKKYYLDENYATPSTSGFRVHRMKNYARERVATFRPQRHAKLLDDGKKSS